MIRKFLAFCLLALLGVTARADVAWQSTATPDTGGAITSLSTTISPSGSNLAVIIGVYGSGQAAPPTVTYAAQTPVLIDDGGADPFEPSLWLYYVIPSAPGSASIVVTFGANCPRCALGAIAYTGVHQTTPVGTPASASESGVLTHTATVTDAVATGLVVDMILVSGPVITMDGGQTLRVEEEDWDGVFNAFGMSDKGGTGSVAMTWTTPDAQDSGHIAVALLPASSTSSAVPVIYNQLLKSKR